MSQMRRLADRFVLEREIGAGGMSVVYLGRDEVLDRPVAVKVLRSAYVGSDVGARFSREGRTAARISHPNVVQVYDAGLADLDGEEVSYIVMEHVPGGDLRDLIGREGALPGEKLAFLGEAASGLAFAHERGIVHRDIKPPNILIDDHGRPKLGDFGIAKALDATQATQTGFYLGTALYSSPEQLQGHGAGPESDIYSLGATLYHAAVGEPPFTGTPIEVASQHVTQTPVPPTERGARIDEATERTIMACLAKDPAERPSAEEVRKTLAWAETPQEKPQETSTTRVQAAPPPPKREPAPEQTAPSQPASGTTVRRRSWVPVLAMVALLALLGVGTALALPAILGSGETGQQSAGGDSNAGGSGGGNAEQANADSSETKSQEEVGNSGDQAQTASSQNESAETASSNGGEGAGSAAGDTEDPTEENGLTSEAASQTVRELYATAASGEYGASYEMLSQGFRQGQAPTQEAWSNQFQTLQSIEFVEGPSASVSGDTATVSGVTIAEHTDRTEQNTVVWTLVNEGGDWKLEGISVQNTEIL
jgi:eukaryotic-like serine/threonine-protein kinase